MDIFDFVEFQLNNPHLMNLEYFGPGEKACLQDAPEVSELVEVWRSQLAADGLEYLEPTLTLPYQAIAKFHPMWILVDLDSAYLN